MSIKQNVKQMVVQSPAARRLLIRLRNKLHANGNELRLSNIHVQKNVVDLKGDSMSVCCDDSSYMQGVSVRMTGDRNCVTIDQDTTVFGEECTGVLIFGDDNRIVIGKGCNLRRVHFFIRGNGNTIIVDDDCSAYNVEFHMEQNGNTIHIGKGTTMHGRAGGAIHMATDEGSGIYIDEDCMLAHSIQIRSTDSHSIVDMSGKRLNPAKDVHIGRHCWLGMQSVILKGTRIQSNTIVAAAAVCSKEYGESHCILAGNPARIVKREVNWDRKFL